MQKTGQCLVNGMIRQISRRSVLGGLLAAGTLGATDGVAQKAGPSRPFTWAGTGGTWGDTLQSVFVDPFVASQNGLRVIHSAQLESVAAAKILASCGSAPYDVSDGPQADYALLNGGSCVSPYDTSIVTSLPDIFDEAKLGNYYAAFNILLFGMTWNTRQATKPTSFNDLALAKYKGKVGVPAYGWYGMTWLHAWNKVLGGTEDNITPGINAVADLVRKNDAVIVDNADHGTRLMDSGEVVIMPYWNGRTVRLQEANIPAAFEIVPGTVLVGSGFSIMQGTSYMQEAQAFVQSTLQPERQLAFTRWSKYPPANKTIKLPPELEGIAIPPGGLNKVAQLDWQKINEYRSPYLERWNKEVLNA
jgi:putative spermidine/putrescine transport system substrate-binding protein